MSFLAIEQTVRFTLKVTLFSFLSRDHHHLEGEPTLSAYFGSPEGISTFPSPPGSLSGWDDVKSLVNSLSSGWLIEKTSWEKEMEDAPSKSPHSFPSELLLS